MSGGLGFAAPGWFLAALLPVAYLLFARALERAPRADFGSLRLWRAAREELGEQAVKPGWRWRTVVRGFGLALVVVAMARPVWTGAAEPRVWTLVVGTGAAGGLAVEDGTTRVQAALAAGAAFGAEREAVRWAPVPRFVDRAASVEANELVWRGGGGATDVAPGVELLVAAPPRTDWLAWDVPDHVWLPTTELAFEPARAGLEQGAWPAAPGPVGLRPGGVELEWDGESVGERLGAEPWVWARGDVWEAKGTLGRVLEATAETNGWRVLRGPAARAAVGVPVLIAWGPLAEESARAAGGSTATATDSGVALDFRPDVQLFGEGWSVLARRANGAAEPMGLRPLPAMGVEPLDAAGAGAVEGESREGDVLGSSEESGRGESGSRDSAVVGWSPGLVWTDLTHVGPPDAVVGGIAQLVVAWAAGLEAATLPAAGGINAIVPLASRRAVAALSTEPRGREGSRSAEGRRLHLGAACALLAAAMLLATLRS